MIYWFGLFRSKAHWNHSQTIGVGRQMSETRGRLAAASGIFPAQLRNDFPVKTYSKWTSSTVMLPRNFANNILSLTVTCLKHSTVFHRRQNMYSHHTADSNATGANKDRNRTGGGPEYPRERPGCDFHENREGKNRKLQTPKMDAV